MNDSVAIYVNEAEERKSKKKSKKTIPIIRRIDIMSGILSTDLNRDERARLSNLYAEITYMEKKDLKYISEIVVSSQSDLEIYEMLKKHNKRKKSIEKKNSWANKLEELHNSAAEIKLDTSI